MDDVGVECFMSSWMISLLFDAYFGTNFGGDAPERWGSERPDCRDWWNFRAVRGGGWVCSMNFRARRRLGKVVTARMGFFKSLSCGLFRW